MRTRLDRYYANPQAAEELRIELPRGGYLPVFSSPKATLPTPEANLVPAAAADPVEPLPRAKPPMARWPLVAAALAVLTIGGAATVFVRRALSGEARLVSISVLNSSPGRKRTMSFSPDGRQLAFSWTGPANSGKGNIWVQALEDGSEAKRLTSGHELDWSPAWSPDGRTIAFVRDPYDKGEVFTMPAEGGSERKVEGVRAFRLQWTPDGKSFIVLHDVPGREVASAVFVVDIASHVSKQVTFPTLAEARGHTNFAVSPAGDRVAYLADAGDTRRVMLAPLDGSSPGVALAGGSSSFGGVDWAPDGNSLFVTEGEPNNCLQRLALRAAAPLQAGFPRLVIPGLEVSNIGHFAAARSGSTRIAANRINANFEIWTQNVGEPGSGRLLLDIEGNAWAPKFSPDGSAIAFLSDRSGSTQIWIAQENGSGSSQVSSSLPCMPISVRWQPGGKRNLIFDCSGASGGVYTVSPDSGTPQRMDVPPDAANPSYSANGELIYFTTRQSGRNEVWTVPAAGPAAAMKQVTHNGGLQGLETPDGKSLIFIKEPKDSALWRLSFADGRETPLQGYAWRGWWEVEGSEVVIAEPEGTIGTRDGGKPKVLAQIGGFIPNRGGFSIHPKKGQIIYGRATQHSEDLILLRFDR